MLTTGPPAYTWCGRARLVTVAGVCHRRSSVVCLRRLSSVGICNTRICNATHQGTALCGPAVLRPVGATPCFSSVSAVLCEFCDNAANQLVDCCYWAGSVEDGRCSSFKWSPVSHCLSAYSFHKRPVNNWTVVIIFRYKNVYASYWLTQTD